MQKAKGKNCCTIGNIVRNEDVPKAIPTRLKPTPTNHSPNAFALWRPDAAGVEFRQIKSAPHGGQWETLLTSPTRGPGPRPSPIALSGELDEPLYRTHVRPKQYPLSGRLRPDKCRRETGHRLFGFGHVFAHTAEHNAADAEIRQHRQVFSGIVVATSEETPLAFDIHRIAWA